RRPFSAFQDHEARSFHEQHIGHVTWWLWNMKLLAMAMAMILMRKEIL
ncbi:hypothetical protein A2U01_0079272, partial [Trifolium medium]|nr:hypothetical protein [Trifolium medium]